MKYGFAASKQKAAQFFVVDKLPALCELEGLLYRPAFYVGTKCLSKDADEF